MCMGRKCGDEKDVCFDSQRTPNWRNMRSRECCRLNCRDCSASLLPPPPRLLFCHIATPMWIAMRGVHINTLSWGTEVAAAVECRVAPFAVALAFIFCLLLSLSVRYAYIWYNMVCHAMPHMAWYVMAWYGLLCFALLWSGSGSGSGSVVFPCVLLLLLLSVFVTLIRKMHHAWLQQLAGSLGGAVGRGGGVCLQLGSVCLLGWD